MPLDQSLVQSQVLAWPMDKALPNPTPTLGHRPTPRRKPRTNPRRSSSQAKAGQPKLEHLTV